VASIMFEAMYVPAPGGSGWFTARDRVEIGSAEEFIPAVNAWFARRGMPLPPSENIHAVGLHNMRADWEAIWPPDPLVPEWDNMRYGHPFRCRFLDDDLYDQQESRRQYEANRGRSWFRKALDR